MRLLVLGTDRAQQHLAAVLERELLLEVLRVGPDREPLGAAALGRRYLDPRVERQHPFGSREQRVDVEFDDLRQVDHQLGDLDQRQADGVEIGRRCIAVALEQLVDARAADHLARQAHIERRQRDGAVGDHLDRRAPLPEQQHRAEDRVGGGADDQLLRTLHARHLLYREARLRYIRVGLGDAREDSLGGGDNRVRRIQVEHHAAHVGLVADAVGEHLQRHRETHPLRGRAGTLRIGGDVGLNHRDRVGREDRLGLGLAEHLATAGQRTLYHQPRGRGRRLEILRRRRRGLGQQLLVAPVANQMHVRADRALGRAVGRDVGRGKETARLGHGHLAHPVGQHVLAVLALHLLEGVEHRLRALGARGDRGRRVHHQHRVEFLRLQQDLQRGAVTAARGVADDVHRVAARPGRRQHRIELLDRLRREIRQRAAEVDQAIDRHDPGTAAVGHDRQPLAARAHRDAPREGLDRGEQLVEVVHAQHAGAADRRIVDVVGAGQRTGVRRGGLRPLGDAPGLDHHHRLDACRGACRRHEGAPLVDRLDVEQDRLGPGIAGQVVEGIAEVDVERVA